MRRAELENWRWEAARAVLAKKRRDETFVLEVIEKIILYRLNGVEAAAALLSSAKD